MSLHIFGAIVTHHGTAANNRAETDGNITTLQKLLWHGTGPFDRQCRGDSLCLASPSGRARADQPLLGRIRLQARQQLEGPGFHEVGRRRARTLTTT